MDTPQQPADSREEIYLLLHGNSGSHHEMEALLPVLRPGVRVLNPDLPQHGENMLPGFIPRIESCARWLRENLSLQKYTLSIIGFSDGANIALEFLRQGGLDIRSVLLLAPNLTLQGLQPWLIFTIRATEILLWGFSWIPALWLIRQRMLMMSSFSFAGPLPDLPRRTWLVYGERDMITPAEQQKMAALLGREALIMESETHMSLPRAHAVAGLIREQGI